LYILDACIIDLFFRMRKSMKNEGFKNLLALSLGAKCN
jgi:hypothetical protein